MTKTYTTIQDLAQAELRDILMSDDTFAELAPTEQADATTRLTRILRERDLIDYEDGWDEGAQVYRLDSQGFVLALDPNLEGADLWDAVSEALA